MAGRRAGFGGPSGGGASPDGPSGFTGSDSRGLAAFGAPEYPPREAAVLGLLATI